MKMLIVDDEAGYRKHLKAAFVQRNYEVMTAATGADAIRVGIAFRPDVLLVDWLLKNHIHGLRVAKALRIVSAQLRTVLITGFPSSDLRTEANDADIEGFVAKPFKMEEIEAAVDTAMGAPSAPRALPPIGVVVTDARGAITYANAKAQQLLATTAAGRGASRLDAVLGSSTGDINILASRQKWVEVSPLAKAPTRWWIRSDHGIESTVSVLLPTEMESFKKDPAVTALLDRGRSASVDLWPTNDRVLVIADTRELRQGAVMLLEDAGCVAYAADTRASALHLLTNEPMIRLVIVNSPMLRIDLSELVGTLRAMRPKLTVVGVNREAHPAALADVGIDCTVSENWDVSELLKSLEGT